MGKILVHKFYRVSLVLQVDKPKVYLSIFPIALGDKELNTGESEQATARQISYSICPFTWSKPRKLLVEILLLYF